MEILFSNFGETTAMFVDCVSAQNEVRANGFPAV